MIQHEIKISDNEIAAINDINEYRAVIANFLMCLGYTTLTGRLVRKKSIDEIAEIFIYTPSIKDLKMKKFPVIWEPEWSAHKKIINRKFAL